jgi:hypothetical protein
VGTFEANVPELLLLWQSPAWLAYLGGCACAGLGLHLVHVAYRNAEAEVATEARLVGLPRAAIVLPVTYASFSALFGTFSVVLAKVLSELVTLLAEGTDIFFGPDAWFTWVTLIAWLAFVGVWLFRMNEALSLYDPLFIIPLLQVNFILFAIISGGIFFEEFSYFQPVNVGGFCIGVFLLLFGIFLLSPEVDTTSPLQQPLTAQQLRASIAAGGLTTPGSATVVNRRRRSSTARDFAILAMSGGSVAVVHSPRQQEHSPRESDARRPNRTVNFVATTTTPLVTKQPCTTTSSTSSTLSSSSSSSGAAVAWGWTSGTGFSGYSGASLPSCGACEGLAAELQGVRLVMVRLEATVKQLQAELAALKQYQQQPQKHFAPPLLSPPLPPPSLLHEPSPPLRALLPPPPQVAASLLAGGAPAEQAAPLAPLVNIQLAPPLAPAKAISDDDNDDENDDNDHNDDDNDNDEASSNTRTAADGGANDRDNDRVTAAPAIGGGSSVAAALAHAKALAASERLSADARDQAEALTFTASASTSSASASSLSAAPPLEAELLRGALTPRAAPSPPPVFAPLPPPPPELAASKEAEVTTLPVRFCSRIPMHTAAHPHSVWAVLLYAVYVGCMRSTSKCKRRRSKLNATACSAN